MIRNYLWGTDLSGSLEGAGGVGGLLKMTYNTPNATNYFVAYDGNGNLAGLIQADTGTHLVTYEYGPFGEPIRNSGAWSAATKTCPIRFSSKYTDDETDLYYYGYRYYNQSLGRWLNRDPIAEKGGKNLCGFVANDCLNRHDKLGLMQSFSGIGTRVKYYCKCGWIDHGHLGTGSMYDKINDAMAAYEANRSADEFTLPQSQTGGGGVS